MVWVDRRGRRSCLVWQLLAVDDEGGLAHVHVQLDRDHRTRAEGGAAPLVTLGRVDLRAEAAEPPDAVLAVVGEAQALEAALAPG